MTFVKYFSIAIFDTFVNTNNTRRIKSQSENLAIHQTANLLGPKNFLRLQLSELNPPKYNKWKMRHTNATFGGNTRMIFVRFAVPLSF